MHTRIDSEGYTLSYGYDAGDRVRTVTYPDSTRRVLDYTNLHLTSVTDRQRRTGAAAGDCGARRG